ncbi:MAG TPA: sorbosone dehydrogenase family protein, partial [Spirochaetota bacterium]
MKHFISACFLMIMAGSDIAFASDPLPLDRIRLPEGFHIELYARVDGARSLALSDNGILFVGTLIDGKVYAVIDESRYGDENKVITIARDLFMPNGVAVKNGDLYVAEVNRIL